MSNTKTSQSSWYAWLVCASSALFFFYEFIQGNMFSSINDEVMKSFQLTMIQAGWLSSIYYLSNVIFLFPASLILDRYPVKRVIVVAMLLCIFGTFVFALSGHFYLALICRFITGIGSAFCFLSCIRLASRWFPSERMALVTGWLVTIAMLGGVISQRPMLMLVSTFHWRMALLINAAFGVFLLVWIILIVKEKPEGYQDCDYTQSVLPFYVSLKYAYGNLQNILAGMYTSLMNLPIALLGAFIGRSYLMEFHHFLSGDASTVNGMLFLGTIVGGPLIGAWSDRLALRRFPMILCTALSMFLVVFILYVSEPSTLVMEISFFLLGFFSSGQIISYALVAESAPLSMTATSVGVISVLTQGGFLLYQNLFSYVLMLKGGDGQDLALLPQAYQDALLLIPYGFVIAMMCAIMLRETHSHRLEEN